MIDSLVNSKKDETDLISVTQHFVSVLKIRITPIEVEETLANHPHFPSIAALTELLDQFNIDNIALKTSAANLDKMEFPAVVQLKEKVGKFTILSACKDGKVTYLDSDKRWKEENIHDFENKWSGTIVMAEPSINSGDPDYTKKLIREKIGQFKLPAIILFLLLLTVIGVSLSPGLASSLLFIVALAGMLVSAAIMHIEQNQKSALIDKVCKTSKTTDCSKVLSSSAAVLFGWLHMSDVGFIYFTGTFLSLLMGAVFLKLPETLSILAILNICALPYTVFSVYYQYKVVKKWCALCLAVQGLIWIQFFTLGWTFTSISFNIDIYSFIIPFLGLTFAGLHVLVEGRLLQSYKSKYLENEKQLKGWKRDHEIFRYLLEKEEKIEMGSLSQEFTIGENSAPVTITAVINPDCGPCGEVLKELLPLINRKGDEVKLALRFAASPNDPMLLNLISLYKRSPQLLSKALNDWYAVNKDYKKWCAIYPESFIPEANEILNEHIDWCDKIGIKSTPTIYVDSYRLPDRYWIPDLKFIIFS